MLNTPALPLIAPPPAASSAQWKALCAMSLTLMLAACGGGGGGVSCPAGVTCNGSGTPATPPPPPPPTAASCADVTGALASNVRFSATDKGADTAVSSTGITACFTTNTPSAVRSTTAIQPGSFYYFEAKRSPNTVAYVGVATSAMPVVPNNTGSTDIYATDQALFVRDGAAETNRIANPGAPNAFNVSSSETNFGFAVDYRGTNPVVYVIGSTAEAATGAIAPTYCAAPGQTVGATTPCVYGRRLLPNVTTPLYIYALGSTFAGGSPKVSINGGTDLTGRAFNYTPLAVRQALRQRWYYGERSFNAQWAQTSATALPTISATSRTNAVVSTTDTTPFTASFTVTATDSAGAALTGSAIQWLSDTGAAIAIAGSATTLSLTDATVQSTIGLGKHRIQAVVTDPTTRQVNAVDFNVTFTNTNSDDDGDGLTYSQEKAANTDPANPDTDGDGLSDGVESSLGLNPLVADNPTAGAKVELRRQTGLGTGLDTSIGVVLDDNKLAIALTSQLNPDCELGRLPAAAFNPQPLSTEQCNKRAIRASEGIKPGEFRYFETHRLIANSGGNGPNTGQGFVAATGKIDPFCCVAEAPNQNTRDTRTPFSFMVNNAASIWDTLVSIASYQTLTTTYIGFAVDYRGSVPVGYVITTAADGTTAEIYGPRPITGFSGDAIPFVYGHPQSDTALAMEINFGLRDFHYAPTTVRTLLQTVGVSASDATTVFRPGVGIHRRP